jgi:hypothetical protein
MSWLSFTVMSAGSTTSISTMYLQQWKQQQELSAAAGQSL